MIRRGTHVLTRIQRRPLSATTSTLTPGTRFFSPFFPAFSAVVTWKVVKIDTVGGGAHTTSFHTAMRYGAFVDNGGRLTQFGSSRNYWKHVRWTTDTISVLERKITFSKTPRSILMFSFSFLSPGTFSWCSHWFSPVASPVKSYEESRIGGRAVSGLKLAIWSCIRDRSVRIE
jgi:hypothetical protein